MLIFLGISHQVLQKFGGPVNCTLLMNLGEPELEYA